jgi:hypothetical protein
MKRIWLAAACLYLAGVSPLAWSDPWLAPGDEGIRNDVQLLADAGIVRGPTTTWPMSWPDIARDVAGADESGLSEDVANALLRVRRLSRVAAARGYSGAGVRVRAAHEPAELRSFVDAPREEGEIGLRASWMSDHIALNLQGAVVADADDGKKLRADGSYLGVNIGNFMVSAGYMERWWGPGWDGSLILSTNARPIPSVTLERNYTDPFKFPLLRWIGPWRASIALGQAESGGVALADVRFLAARVAFKPRPWLELALTRTAQWCGEGRSCTLATFRDLLLGQDNQLDNGSPSEQPGNQMAGYDVRIRSPWRALPVAFYAQMIGEDEAGGLPSKFLGLMGVETWMSTSIGSLRLRGEYADTTCVFTRADPEFSCAYRNALFPQGYTHRGRVIGHSMDNDSRMTSAAALLVRPDGDVLGLTVRKLEINRDGGPHSISLTPDDLMDVEFRFTRQFDFGMVAVGLGHDEKDARAFLTWRQGF